MKKLILSTMTAGAVLSLGISQAHADTYAEDTYMPSKETKKPIKIALPDAKSKSVIDQMKKGTYNVNDVVIGMTYGEAIGKIGVSKDESINRMDKQSNVYAFYKTASINAAGDSRYTAVNDMKVDNISFNYSKKNINYKDISKLLGKYDSSETYGDETKTLEDDYLVRDYGHLQASFNHHSSGWVLENLTVKTNDDDINDGSKPLKDRNIKNVTTADIALMVKGTYNFMGIKPGMKHEDVLNIAGESSTDSISRDKNIVVLNANYGNEGMLSFEYKMSTEGQLILKNMNWMTFENDQKLATLEKVLGKADKTKKDSYDSEVNGVKKKSMS